MARFSPSTNMNHYRVYRHLVPWPLLRLRNATVERDPYDPAVEHWITARLTGSEPFFFGRIGGCEYEAASAYFRNNRAFVRREDYLAEMERIQELAGYFDFEHDYENFIRFLDNQATYYRDADCLFYAGLVLLTRFRHNIFTYGDMRLLNHVCGGKRLIDYTFVEAVMPFLNSFKTWGDGRRILIISPFSRSLQSQYERLDELIVDFQYPSFDLVTYTSPLTWSTMQDTRLTLGVTTDNWHQECQRMTAEIAELAFDIALLSCGSYTMHLGNFIRHTMEKKAVYVGGMLNVFFNIYGERYNTPFYNRFMRADTQIEAIENDMAESLSGGKKLASEAARAYFGRIPSPTPE